jgi:DNA-binding transcriptional ArsR family regulator
MTSSELEEALIEKGSSQRTAQRIISELKDSGVLNVENAGRNVYYSFNDDIAPF